MTDPKTRPNRPFSEPVGRRMLTPEQIDDVAEAVLALTREVYVLTDRLRVLEAVLDARGLDVHAEIERFQTTPRLQEELNAKRDAIVASVLTPMGAFPDG